VAGTFHGDRSIQRDDEVHAGDVLGHVGTTEIRSGFTGLFGGLLALDGQRMSPSEPVAWLRLS
jgi:hypothetical protein